MCPKIAIVYNEPIGEEEAIVGVLDEVKAVHQALAELGYPVIRVPLCPPFEHVRDRLKGLEAELVFNLFEGFECCPETEAMVADILSELGIPYTGCSSASLSLALDKAKTKALLEAAGIATPRYQLLSPRTLSSFDLGYPCIVKPSGEDASHGLSEESVVRDFASLGRQVAKVSKLFGGKALVEEFVDGREFNATILGKRELAILPISEIVYSLPPLRPRILTFAAKWQPYSLYFQCTKPICPAEIGVKEREHIAQVAISVFRLVGCYGYARVDMRLDTEGRLMVLEVNPNPDISPDSGAVRQAKVAGVGYSQFIEKIVMLALETNSSETTNSTNDS